MMSNNPRIVYLVGRWWFLLLFVGLFALLASQPAYAAPLTQTDCATEMTVSTAAELNNAIVCYNIAGTPGEYGITLANDIPLSAATTGINKPSGDYNLRIEGNGHSVDGQNINGVRPFWIATGTFVTMQAITVTRGNVDRKSVV